MTPEKSSEMTEPRRGRPRGTKEIQQQAERTGRALRGGRGGADYEHWSVDDLRRHARQLGIGGRSRMNKKELITKLRQH